MAGSQSNGALSADSVTVLLPQLRHKDDRRHPDFQSVETIAWDIGQRLGRKIPVSYIQQIEWGKSPPSQEVLEAIAEHFGVSPLAFGEYRLARARDLLDERAVGAAVAAENYELLAERVPELRAATERIADVDGGELERALAELEAERRRVLDRAGTAGEVSPPPLPTEKPAARRRAGRPRRAAS